MFENGLVTPQDFDHNNKARRENGEGCVGMSREGGGDELWRPHSALDGRWSDGGERARNLHPHNEKKKG